MTVYYAQQPQVDTSPSSPHVEQNIASPCMLLPDSSGTNAAANTEPALLPPHTQPLPQANTAVNQQAWLVLAQHLAADSMFHHLQDTSHIKPKKQ